MGFSPAPAAPGITKLSELEIDANKDWAVKGIDSLAYVIIEDGAGHYMRLPVLTTVNRDALTAVVGMVIWNSTTTRVERYDGSDWGSMGISGVTIRQNSSDDVGTRPRLNLHQGAGIEITTVDDAASDEIDITITERFKDKFIVLLPEDAALHSVSGAARVTIDGTVFSYILLDFDPGTEKVAAWENYLSPNYLDENIYIDIYWVTTATEGNCMWGFATGGRIEGETWDAALGTEHTVVSAAPGAAGQIQISRIGPVIPGWSPGDLLAFKLARKAADGEDTMNADARVLKVVVSYTAEVPLAQSFYEVTPYVEVTPVLSASWEDVDISAYVPVGTAAAILELWATEAGRYFGLRKKGSTDDRYFTMGAEHAWAIVGLDDNRMFEMKRQVATSARAFLVGYCGPGVNYPAKSPYNFKNTSNNTWQVKDLSAVCPSAIGIVLEVVNSRATYAIEFGVRKYGSSDDRYNDLRGKGHYWVLIGCDENQKIDTRAEAKADLTFYVVGYITSGAQFFTNALDQSLSIADEAWHDLPHDLHAQAAFGFFEVAGFGNYDIRKKDGTANHYTLNHEHAWAIIPCDTDKKCEGKIDRLTCDFWQVGFATTV